MKSWHKTKIGMILLLAVAACNPSAETNSYAPTKQSLANEVRRQACIQLKNEKALFPCGIGAGMMDKIRMLALSFNYYEELSIEEARDLLMYASHVFLEKINRNEKIGPFLLNYPFKPENISVTIYLRNTDGSNPGVNKLQVLVMNLGTLEYKIHTPGSKQFKTILKETFEEAEKKLDTIVVF